MERNFKIESFRSVMNKHNENISKLNTWRDQFSRHAKELTDFLFIYANGELAKKSNKNQWRTDLEGCFKKEIRYNGNQNVFDPWNGWWKGDWQNGTSNTKQYHIWGKTVEYSNQHIQPVSQSVSSFVNKTNIESAVKEKKVDLGINVWSLSNGITGWVSKRQNRQTLELPHIGYSPNANTLIWIMQVNWQHDFYMFFEWADPAQGKYGIHGRKFLIQGGKITQGTVAGWATYSQAKIKKIQ